MFDIYLVFFCNDEWVDYEIVLYCVGMILDSNVNGSYVCQVYLWGMVMEEEGIINFYKFGLIGLFDIYVFVFLVNEDNYWFKVGLFDGNVEGWGLVLIIGFQGMFLKIIVVVLIIKVEGRDYLCGIGFEVWSVLGLIGVWVEENIRELIYVVF